jgi:hypothetical protein
MQAERLVPVGPFGKSLDSFRIQTMMVALKTDVCNGSPALAKSSWEGLARKARSDPGALARKSELPDQPAEYAVRVGIAGS